MPQEITSKEILSTLQDAHDRLVLYDRQLHEPIAVIGMSCRFPGNINSPEEFWKLLVECRQGVRELSDSELEAAGIAPETYSRPDYVKIAATLENIDQFDATFFGINPRDVEMTDPQHRLLLECTWEALEHSGYGREAFRGEIGFFAGASIDQYFTNNLHKNPMTNHADNFQFTIGNEKDYLTSKVAHKLNFRGPVVNVQTACSTSLVAVHLACQSLRQGECSMAVAGGVTVKVPHNAGYFYREGGIRSPDGMCRPFDIDADGTVEGNGIGIVVLKPLYQARQDGDYIYALVKGSAINNDGSQKVNFAAPAVKGQEEVIVRALKNAHINPDSLQYLEAHGTGTKMGDPVEITAATKAFRRWTSKNSYCLLGSVKSNIGHSEAAAGVAGLIKVCLSLQKSKIPPSLHFKEANSKINFKETPFQVNDTLRDWVTNGVPRRAAVSSFGIGGTNAHVILEEATQTTQDGYKRSHHILPISAKSELALLNSRVRLANFIKENHSIELKKIAYTLAVGREGFNYRSIILCENENQALGSLDKKTSRLSKYQEQRDPPVTFIFPGQGSLYPGVTKELYGKERDFSLPMDTCLAHLDDEEASQLKELIFSSFAEKDHESNTAYEESSSYQLALFCIEYSLAKMWMAWGIIPSYLMGHSLGEYVAACISGVFSLENALLLVQARAQLMQELASGKMLAVALSEKDALAFIKDATSLSIAAVNSPKQCVISGCSSAVDKIRERMEEEGVYNKLLDVSSGFHSNLVEPILGRFLEIVRLIKINMPRIPYISNVSGDWVQFEQISKPQYWSKHLRDTVRFSDGVQKLLEKKHTIFLEVGAGRGLLSIIRSFPTMSIDRVCISSLSEKSDNRSETKMVYTALGKLWLEGLDVDWKHFYKDNGCNFVPLPTYPFEKKRFWINPYEGVDAKKAASNDRKSINNWFYIQTWKHVPWFSQVEPNNEVSENKRCLFFDNGSKLSSTLRETLREQNVLPIVVTISDSFAKIDTYRYCINPELPDDYQSLFKSLDNLNLIPKLIIHCWSVSIDKKGCHSIEVKSWEELGFFSLFNIIKTFARHEIKGDLRVAILSDNVENVSGTEDTIPEKALILGGCKAIQHEFSNSVCKHFDVGSIDEESFRNVSQSLLGEFFSDSSDTRIAYRGKHRWVQHFERVILPEPHRGQLPNIRRNGVYWITGGLGGLGLTFAKFIAETRDTKLVLIQRSPFPPPNERDNWLVEHQGNDKVSSQIRAIKHLGAKGVEVCVLQADVCNFAQMNEVYQETLSLFGRLNGVIHAAGLPGGGLMAIKSRSEIEEVLAPKVKGLRILEQILQKTKKIDFLILCSSVTSFLGGPGRGDYCAANVFMDSFAKNVLLQSKLNTISINWDAWKDVGMAATEFARANVKPHEDIDLNTTFPDHPFFDEKRSDIHKVQYITYFNAEKHWVVKDHRIFGVHTVPGTGLLEMVVAALHADDEALVIENIQFLRPLSIPHGNTLTTFLTIARNDKYQEIQIYSHSSPLGGNRTIHLQGRARRVKRVSFPTLNIEKHIQRMSIEEHPDRLITAKNNLDAGDKIAPVSFGESWEVGIESLYRGKSEYLACLSLPYHLQAVSHQFYLHPSLLDVATSFASRYTDGDSFFLPFSYGKIIISDRLPNRIFSYAKEKTSERHNVEILKYDITVTDEKGNQLISIEDFAMKRVDSSKLLKSSLDTEKADHVDFTTFDLSNPDNIGISPNEGMEILKRVIPQHNTHQIIVSVSDFQSRIRTMDDFSLSAHTGLYDSVVEQTAIPRPSITTVYKAPTNELERRLVQIWQQLLGIEKIGIDDNYVELGGDSLLAQRLVDSIKAELSVNLSVISLYEALTVRMLAKLLTASNDPESTQSIDREDSAVQIKHQKRREFLKSRRKL